MSTIQRLHRESLLRFPDDPPHDLRCPNCHHNYEVIASRKSRYVSRLNATLFHYFHCRVCDYQFQKINLRSVFAFTSSISLIIGGIIALNWFVLSHQQIFQR